jgi:hypothetical protein
LYFEFAEILTNVCVDTELFRKAEDMHRNIQYNIALNDIPVVQDQHTNVRQKNHHDQDHDLALCGIAQGQNGTCAESTNQTLKL